MFSHVQERGVHVLPDDISDGDDLPASGHTLYQVDAPQHDLPVHIIWASEKIAVFFMVSRRIVRVPSHCGLCKIPCGRWRFRMNQAIVRCGYGDRKQYATWRSSIYGCMTRLHIPSSVTPTRFLILLHAFCHKKSNAEMIAATGLGIHTIRGMCISLRSFLGNVMLEQSQRSEKLGGYGRIVCVDYFLLIPRALDHGIMRKLGTTGFAMVFLEIDATSLKITNRVVLKSIRDSSDAAIRVAVEAHVGHRVACMRCLLCVVGLKPVSVIYHIY